VQGGLLLNIVIGERAPVIELLAREDEALLFRRNPLLVLNLNLDIADTVRRLHLKGDGRAGEGLHKDLHHLRASNKRFRRDAQTCVGVDVIQFRNIQHSTA